jgi:hypothetical protein
MRNQISFATVVLYSLLVYNLESSINIFASSDWQPVVEVQNWMVDKNRLGLSENISQIIWRKCLDLSEGHILNPNILQNLNITPERTEKLDRYFN